MKNSCSIVLRGFTILVWLCVVATADPARGIISLWNGGSGSWHILTNWTPFDELPGADDYVIIGSGTPTHSTGSTAILGLTCTGGLVVSGGTLSVGGAVQMDGPLTINGGNLYLYGVSNSNFDGHTELSAGSIYGTGGITFEDLHWTGGSLSNTGEILIDTGRTLDISGVAAKTFGYVNNVEVQLTNRGNVIIGGTGNVHHAGGVNAYVTLANTASGVIDIQSGAGFNYAGSGTRVIENAGLFKKSAGGTSSVAWDIANTGMLDVQAGTLSVSGNVNNLSTIEVGGAILNVSGSCNNGGVIRAKPGATVNLSGGGASPGAFDVKAGATLSFSAGTHALGGSTYTNAGTVNLNGATCNFGAATSIPGVVNFSSGTIGGDGEVTFTNLTWTAGTSVSTGGVRIAPSGTLNLSGPGTKTFGYVNNEWVLFTNNGAATLSGTGNISHTGGLNAYVSFVNAATGVFDIQGDAGITYSGSATQRGFENRGVLKKSAGTGTSNISWQLDNTGSILVQSGRLNVDGVFNNGGIAEVQSGELTATTAFNNSGTARAKAGTSITLTGGGTSSGAFQVEMGASLNFFGGTHTLGGSAYANSGTVNLNGATCNFGAATSIPGVVNFSSGTIGGDGEVTFTNLTWTAGTSISTGGLRIAPGGTLNLSGPGTKTFGYVNNEWVLFTNNGAATLSGTGNISHTGGLNAYVSFVNAATGVFDIQGDAGITYSGSATQRGFENRGVLKKSAGTGTSNISWQLDNTGSILVQSGRLNVDGIFNNGGVVEVQSGELTVSATFNNSGTAKAKTGTSISLNGGGTSPGAFQVEAGATLNFTGGTHNLGGTSHSNAGTVNLNGALSSFGAATNLPGVVNFSSGTIGGDGEVTFTNLTWTAGTSISTGGLRIAPGGTLNLSGPGTKTFGYVNNKWVLFTNNGAATLSGTGNISHTGGLNAYVSFVNAATGVFDIQGDAGITYSGSATQRGFENRGVLKKSAGTGTSNISWQLDNTGSILVQSGRLNVDGIFNNGGVVEVQSGELTVSATFNNSGTAKAKTGTSISLNGGGTSPGAFQVEAGATLNFTGGTHNLGGTTYANAGTVNFNGAVCSFGAATNVPGVVNLTSGSVGGDKEVSFSNLTWSAGAIDSTGGVRVAPGGIVNMSGPGAKTFGYINNKIVLFTNNGTATLTGSGNISHLGGTNAYVTFTNTSTGVFDIQSDAGFVYSNAGTRLLSNAGLLKKSASTGTSSISWNVDNAGTVEVDSGTLRFQGTFTQPATGRIVVNGGTANFANPLTVQGMLTGNGTIAAATVTHSAGVVSPGLSAGTLTIDGNLTLSATSVVQYDLGTVSDRLVVNGNLNLAGLFDFTAAPGFGPGTYRLVDYTGTLTTTSPQVRMLPSGCTAQFSYDATLKRVNLVVDGPYANPTWNVDASGDWNTSTNWGMGIPNGTGATATLGTRITSPRLVYTAAPVKVGTLTFDSDQSYTIAGTHPTGMLTLETASGKATVQVARGDHKLDIPLTVASNTDLNVAAGATLHLSNPVTVNAGKAINLVGGGNVVVDVRLAGGTISASAGTLSINSQAVVSAESGLTFSGTALLSGSGTIEDSPVVYHSSATSTFDGAVEGNLTSLSLDGGGVLVLNGPTSYGGNTDVLDGKLIIATGGIDSNGTGTGDTVIGRSGGTTTATLITEHIHQDTLTINASGKVKIDGSGTSVVNFLNIANGSGSFSWSAGSGGIEPLSFDATQNKDAVAPVPEPATWLLVSMAALAGLLAWRRRG